MEHLEKLYILAAMQKWSWAGSKDKNLHDEIVKWCNYICNQFHYSNYTINKIFELDERFSPFKYDFGQIFNQDEIIINNDYKISITIA